MPGHRDIPDEVVKRAQLYDAAHWREDRNGERGGSWGSVPADQVRRLLRGAQDGLDLLSLPWRAGRKNHRTIYVQIGPEPSDDDPFIGCLDSAELSAEACAGHNALLEGQGGLMAGRHPVSAL